ncbi:MAG TPA: response regulator [Herpetosiphonaceae bacterium]
MSDRQTPTVLLIEDSDEDYEATVRTFKKIGRAVEVRRCADGDEALDLLFGRRPPAADWRSPQLILLDLNLPATDGRDVLIQLKQDARLRAIPVVILTTSANGQDVAACYHDGANGYVLKPVNLDQFATLLRQVCDYWFGAVLLPEGV